MNQRIDDDCEKMIDHFFPDIAKRELRNVPPEHHDEIKKIVRKSVKQELVKLFKKELIAVAQTQ